MTIDHDRPATDRGSIPKGPEMSNGADVLVEGLVRCGVRHLFGMPGSHSTAIYDALARSGSIATILARNEQAGAFMADGYARVTGVPGWSAPPPARGRPTP